MIEIGAGTGLVSIVASLLGEYMICLLCSWKHYSDEQRGQRMWLVLLRDLFESFQEQETVNSKRLVWKHVLVGFLFYIFLGVY